MLCCVKLIKRCFVQWQDNAKNEKKLKENAGNGKSEPEVMNVTSLEADRLDRVIQQQQEINRSLELAVDAMQIEIKKRRLYRQQIQRLL